YAVQLAAVDVKQVADGEVIRSSRGDEEGSTVYDPFYFTQRSDGQLVEVMLGREEMAEVATFKRGVVNALNVTVRDSLNYEVMETDISGTHLATYSVTESGKGKAILNRQLRKGGESLLKSDDLSAFDYQAVQNTSLEFDLDACQMAAVNIDEEVVVLEPGAGDPGVSDVFRHERLSVRAAASMILTGVGLPSSSTTLPTKAERADMVRIPVNAAIAESLESVRGGERADELLRQLRDDAKNEQLISELGQMLRQDSAALGAFARFVDAERPTGDLAHTLGSLAIGAGSPRAQTALAGLLSSATLDDATRGRLVGLSVLIDRPTPALVKTVARLARSVHTPNGMSATLVLGERRS
ncbi:MAG: hypothetical protein AAFX50_24025, partial [Acidobacteriota bacterium]